MLEVKDISEENIIACTQIYIKAYAEEPWNEKYEQESLHKYIKSFISNDLRYGWALCEDSIVVGMMLGMIIPAVESDYFRIEDFCIDPEKKSMGYGSSFINLISEKLKDYHVDSILLNTQKDFPSHHFYIKNGFKEINSSIMLYLKLI